MLYGRDVERSALEALLAGAFESRSGVLVLRGEPGVGKSALLDLAAELAGDLRVLRAVGLESESELAFAGLHQLLRPVLDRIDELPESQAAALASAFGMGSDPGVDRFLVSLALLTLLAEVADDAGVLCLVDDVHWIDAPSADALVFVARRLEAEGIVLLLAARLDEGREFAAAGLPELVVGNLAPTDAGALLRANAAAPVAPAVAERLIAGAHGNPLVLMELAASLSADQLAGHIGISEPLPVAESVHRSFLRRVRELDADAQALLLLAAADDAGVVAVILDAAERLDIDRSALDELERAGLAHVEPSGLRFRHPLIRSVVYASATFGQRQSAHLALAEALQADADADRRAWHRAAAAAGTDPEIAEELERSAVRARLRGGHAAAAAALERSADLSPAGPARAARLLAAAEAHRLAGRLSRIPALLDRAEPDLPDAWARATAAGLRGAVALDGGAPADAYPVLVAGAAEIAASQPAAALELLVRAAEAAWFQGRLDWMRELAGIAATMPHSGSEAERFMVGVLVGTYSMLGGDVGEGVSRLRAALADAHGFEHPRYLLTAAVPALWSGDDNAAHDLYARAAARLRAAGAFGDLPLALLLLANIEWLQDRLGPARATAVEGLRLARDTGQDTAVCHQLTNLAQIAAIQGREHDSRECAREALQLAAARGMVFESALATWALGSLELALGRPDRAVSNLDAIVAQGGPAAHPLVALFAAPDRAEAAARAGQPAAALDAHRTFSRWSRHANAGWTNALSERLIALVAENHEAEAHFHKALDWHSRDHRPLAHARTQLLYGEWLRRARRRLDARDQLRPALAGFESIGADPWAERARAELRATGETARKRDPSTLDQLTPQELQIATLVSEGASNREVAAKLFLSARTVEYHLYKVFKKLGIASRHELAALLPFDAAEPLLTPIGRTTDTSVG